MSTDGVLFTEVLTKDINTGSSTIILPDTVLNGVGVTANGGGSALYSFRDVVGNIAGTQLPEFVSTTPPPNRPNNVTATAGNGS